MAIRDWFGGSAFGPNNWFGVGNWGFLGPFPNPTPISSDEVRITSFGAPFVEIASSGAEANVLVLTNGNTLNLTGSGSLAVGSIIRIGAMNGVSTLNVAAGTTVSTGTLSIGADIGGAGAADLNGGFVSASSTFVGSASAGALTLRNGGTLSSGPVSVGSGGNHGTITIGGAGVSAEAAGTLAATSVALNTFGSSLVFHTSNSVTFTPTISGAGYVSVNSAGQTVTINNANSYFGGTAISNGSVLTNNGAGLGTGAILFDGASGALRTDANITIANNIIETGNGTISAAAGTTLNLTGSFTFAAGAANVLHLGAAGDTGTIVISASGLTSNFASSLSIDAGTVRAGNSFLGSISSQLLGTNIAAGAVLDLNGFGANISHLSGGGNIVNGGASAALLQIVEPGTQVYSGAISNAGGGAISLQFLGAGTLILSGNNAYTGTTAISSGATLRIGNGGASGTLGSGAVVNDGSLVFDRSNSYVVGNAISGTGSLTQTGLSDLYLTGNNTYSGGTTIDAGSSLIVGAGAASGTMGTGNVVNNGGLDLNRSDNFTFSNAISGTGYVRLFQSSVTALTGANSYSGATSVFAGTLKGGAENTFSANSAVAVSVGATLDLGGFDQTIGGLSGGGLVTSSVNTGAGTDRLLITGASSSTFSGTIENGGAGAIVQLEKYGAGTLTLTGASTFSGAAGVLGGTLALSGTGSIVNATVQVENGSVFDISAASAPVFVDDLYTLSTGTVRLIGKTLNVTNLAGDLGAVTFAGGAGVDALNFTLDASFADASLGAALFTTWSPGDTITLTGNALDNVLAGTSQIDTINGGLGDDTLLGGAGADTLNGATGTDTVDYSVATTVAIVHLDTPTQYGQYGSGAGGAIETDTLISIENVTTGSGADYVYGSSGNNVVNTGAGNDAIYAGLGADTINAGSDQDYAEASYGADTVDMGAGDDKAYGGADNDILYGGTGRDSLYGDHGADQLYGGDGIDVLFVDSTDTVYDGGAGIDYIVWQDVTVAANLDVTAHSADYFYGYTGNDIVTAVGATVRAELHGGGGNDTLSGSAGVGSILLGEGDNDRLIGNTGIDHMVGGAGADTFVFGPNGGTDYVYDFKTGGADKVDFTALAGVHGLGDLTVITAYSGGGWYGYSYGTGTVWLNTTASGVGQPAAGDFLFA